jgi:hypothetical protein
MYPPMPGAGSALDGPPPSPQSVGAGPTGAPTPMSLDQMAPPIPSGQLPPEMLTGIMQSAQTIAQLLDSYAQATPDLAQDWAQLKDGLAAVLAKLMQAGSAPTSPTATGPAFPAAFDRGLSGAGTQ